MTQRATSRRVILCLLSFNSTFSSSCTLDVAISCEPNKGSHQLSTPRTLQVLDTNKPMKQRTVGWDQTLGQNMVVHPLFLKFLIQKGFTPFRLFKLVAHLSSGFAPAP